VAFLGDGDEIAEVAEFDLTYLLSMDFAVGILWIGWRRFPIFVPAALPPRVRPIGKENRDVRN
jgi:hypothetical protein